MGDQAPSGTETSTTTEKPAQEVTTTTTTAKPADANAPGNQGADGAKVSE